MDLPLPIFETDVLDGVCSFEFAWFASCNEVRTYAAVFQRAVSLCLSVYVCAYIVSKYIPTYRTYM